MNSYIFQIETCSMCNLACPECAIGGNVVNRKKQFMSFDNYKIIADKIKSHASYIYLHIWGEPLLNPDIFDIINYTSKFVRSNISTNGMCVSSDISDKLILSGVTDVIVSIDGVSNEVYSKYRVGGDVETAFNALRLLNDSNIRHGNNVRIIPQYIVFKHNQHEIDKFKSICNELKLNPYFKAPYLRNNDKFQVSDDPVYIRPSFKSVNKLMDAMANCKSFLGGRFILVDGTVVACCSDYNGTTCFGNILYQDFDDIYNSQKFKKFETQIFSGNIPSFCIDNCMSWSLDKRISTKKYNAISFIESILNKLKSYT